MTFSTRGDRYAYSVVMDRAFGEEVVCLSVQALLLAWHQGWSLPALPCDIQVALMQQF